MSFAELKFIEAEANFMLGNIPQAQSSFEDAVASSILKITGNINQDWLDFNILGKNINFELIMTQKYIATVGTNQPYTDYRRTGFPLILAQPPYNLTPMPVRFPYAQDEINYNEDNVPMLTLNDKLWWHR